VIEKSETVGGFWFDYDCCMGYRIDKETKELTKTNNCHRSFDAAATAPAEGDGK